MSIKEFSSYLIISVIRYFPNQAINFAFKDKYKRYFNQISPPRKVKMLEIDTKII